MTIDFWLGLAVLPAAAVTVALVRMAWAASTWVWGKLHIALLERIDLAPDPVAFKDWGKAATYKKRANTIRDALMRSPHLYVGHGLGWFVAIVRDTRKSK